MLKKSFLFLIFIYYFNSVIFAEQPWFFYYKLGLDKIKDKQYEEALAALNKAVELNSVSSSHARTYGMNFIEYYPYFYIAFCQYNLGNLSEAKFFLDKELDNGAIDNSRDVLSKAYWLRNKIEEDKRNKPTQIERKPPIISSQKGPPPFISEKENIREKLKGKLADDPEFRKNMKLLRDSIADYFNGEYTQCIIKLSEITFDLPPRFASLKNFILGSSHASLYYLEGETNDDELKLAKHYFSKVNSLPKQFENKFMKYVSPRILVLYEKREQ